MTGHRHHDLTLYARLLTQARPYWLHLVAILLLGLLAAPLAVLAPLPLKVAVDSAIGSQPVPPFLNWMLPAQAVRTPGAILLLAVLLLVAISLMVRLKALASWVLETYTGEALIMSFRTRLFEHLQRLSIGFHDAKGTCDSVYRIQYDAPYIQYILVNGVVPLASAALTLAGMIYVTARLDVELALIALAVSPLLFLATREFGGRVRAEWSELKKSDSSAMSVVHQAVSAARVVKAFGGEERERHRFATHASRRMRGQVRAAFMQGSFDVVVGLIVAVGTAAALYVGVQHVRSGRLTLGALLVVMAYLAQLYEPMKTLSKKLTDLQSGLASCERAFALLDEHPEVEERADARPLQRARGEIGFESVSFAYPNDRAALRDVTFRIAAGTRLGIAGRTGAGKTTLTNLIARFFDPASGAITLDGVDLRDYRLSDLRRQFALVLQEPVLFSSSIAENIEYARPGATRDEVIAAAKAANVHDFISRLRQGYETLVGERGMMLSGGERQRISLARAFLKDAPILILDEPTSSVDTATEREILQTMERLMRGRTAILIAHRLSTLDICDARMELEYGRIIRVSGHVECTATTLVAGESAETARGAA